MADDRSQLDRCQDSPLAEDEQIVVASVIAQAAEASLPLPETLLAAADDVFSGRTAVKLRQLAGQLRQGRSLDELCQGPQRRFSRYVAGLIRAGQRGGDLGETLTEWIVCRQAVRHAWQSVVAAMLYPAVLLVLLLALLGFMDRILLGPMLKMYDEFELELPLITQLLAWFHHHFVPVVAIGGLSLAASLLLF
jgi:general secretion pathway protein F